MSLYKIRKDPLKGVWVVWRRYDHDHHMEMCAADTHLDALKMIKYREDQVARVRAEHEMEPCS